MVVDKCNYLQYYCEDTLYTFLLRLQELGPQLCGELLSAFMRERQLA